MTCDSVSCFVIVVVSSATPSVFKGNLTSWKKNTPCCEGGLWEVLIRQLGLC